MADYVGVDLGATHVRAVVGSDGRGGRRGAVGPDILAREERPTPKGPAGIDVTEAVLEVVRRACDRAGTPPSQVAAAGIASFGPLDLAEGTVEGPANFPDSVEQIPLTGPVGTLLETDQVYLHNDAAAGVVGERFYHEANPDDMVYLTISSGIGAGVCVDGHVLSGWDGNAGELGHMTLDPTGLMTCGCGHDGHWEAYCSGENVHRYARRLHDEDPVETALPLEDPEFSTRDVFEYADDDAFAGHVVEQVAHWNAMGDANLIHAYAPLVVTVGGAVALNNPTHVVEPLRERLEEMVFINVPQIEPTSLGSDVVVKGALASAATAGTGDRSRL